MFWTIYFHILPRIARPLVASGSPPLSGATDYTPPRFGCDGLYLPGIGCDGLHPSHIEKCICVSRCCLHFTSIENDLYNYTIMLNIVLYNLQTATNLIKLKWRENSKIEGKMLAQHEKNSQNGVPTNFKNFLGKICYSPPPKSQVIQHCPPIMSEVDL